MEEDNTAIASPWMEIHTENVTLQLFNGVVVSLSMEDGELKGLQFTLKGLVDYMNDKVNTKQQEEEEKTTGGEEQQNDKETYSLEFLKGILFLLDDSMIQVAEQPSLSNV
eukprot:10130367-Ditylum_brightwellii.AAC.1